MAIEHVLNAPRLRGCIESPRAVGEWWAYCPCSIGKRRLLIRAYSNDAASIHCMRQCPEALILALLGLSIDDLRGRDGKLPDIPAQWYEQARRYACDAPIRPMGEQ